MSQRPITKPLEGDVFRIEQLKEKLAQVNSQNLFGAQVVRPIPSRRNPPGNGTDRPVLPIKLPSDRYSPNIGPVSPGYDGASIMSERSRRNSRESLAVSVRGQRRIAPAIAPAAAKPAAPEARKDYHAFRLLPGHSMQHTPAKTTSPELSVPSSDVVPFLYQDMKDVKRTGKTSVNSLPTSTIENSNLLELSSNEKVTSNAHKAFSPLNPHKQNNLQHAASISKARERPAVKIAAPIASGPPNKGTRSFFNNFIHKKKRDGAHQKSPSNESLPPRSAELFTSPFESPPAISSQRHTSIRLPVIRRQTAQPDSILRAKNSIVSEKSPGTSISTNGITLDTDLSHMAGIIRPTSSTFVPKNDFTFENTRDNSTTTNAPRDFGEATWAPPESWAVRRPEDIAKDDMILDGPDPLDDQLSQSCAVGTVPALAKTTAEPAKRGPNHQMRIFRGDWTFATVACALQTTVESLMVILARKFFLPSVANYQILLERNGLSRILQSWEKPFVLQLRLLEEAGYTDQDRLEEIGREDNSYLCRFIFTTFSMPSFSLDAEAGDVFLEHIDLSGRNVQTIPIVLYKHAGTLRSLDVSRNLSLDIPIDFIQGCPNLQSMVYNHNEAPKLPANLIHAKSLVLLDVSFNRITELHEQMDQLTDLVSLIARNNRITRLPASMGMMHTLRRLNLSSNLIKKFPKEICSMVNLEDLDLSFNRISSVPEAIGDLSKLQRFLINNNRILGTLPRAFARLLVLREVDLRFNLLTTLDVLSLCPMLESISAGHNAVTVVESDFAAARLFHLNKCPVTKFTLQTCGLTLTSLDLSNAKLPSIPDAMFDNLTNLIKLVLDNNHFTYLPPQLGKLTRLQHLSCTSNQLSVLPEELGNLSELKVLDVHSNNLKTIPASVWLLTELISFNASSNLLANFPEPAIVVPPKEVVASAQSTNGLSPVVEEITFPSSSRKSSVVSILNKSVTTMAHSLKYLYLGDNRMDELCFDSISLLQELRVLNLSFNDIYEIPNSALSRLHHLIELYLSGNELTSLPADDLEQLQTLRVLHVNANKLQTLPAEIGKIRRLLVLDVGSNALKYNTANWPYDWNWNWNLDLKYLNLSGNKRLEIKPSNNAHAGNRNLSDFNALTRLRVLGLMDITLTIDSVPEETENRRVRLSGSDISNLSYGQADTLGRHDHLSIIDMVIPRFQGRDDEILFGMFDGSEVQNGGSKVSKHLQDFFAEHIAVELKRLRKDEGVPAAVRRAFLSFNKELGAAVTPIPTKGEADSITVLPQSQRPSMISQSSAAFSGPYLPTVLGADDRTAGAAVCLVYLVGKRAFVANVGDSLAVLSKADGEANLLSVKHNAGDTSEIQRIRQAGGYVSRDGLVNDQLDVTRSVGYFHLTPLIQAAPHVQVVDLTEEDEFIIIASKSLWEVMSFQTAVDIARSEHEDLMLAAQKLRDFAISYGALGKISVMIVGVGDLFHRKSKLMKMRNASTVRGAGGGFLVNDDDLLTGYKSRRRAADTQPADSTLARLTREVPPPVGEVAMIFTDIKNSTLLWETHPVAMRSAIKIHNGIMRRQLRSIGGYEVKTEGDAFMVCFPTTTSALLWCLTVQTQLLVADWPQEILDSQDGKDVYDAESGALIYRGISVRMGMHWGSPVCEVDPITRRMDYFGPMVNRAARISGVADGGQITVSADVVRDIDILEQLHRQYVNSQKEGKIVEDTAEEQAMLAIKKDMQMLKRIGFGISPLGERRLKGLENAEFISLAYPKTLGGRLIQGIKDPAPAKPLAPSGPRALDYKRIVEVYAVVFRLENLCSTVRGNRPKLQNRVNVLSKVTANAYSNADDDMRLAAALENLLTRIENAIGALTLHYSKTATDALIKCTDMQLHDILQVLRAHQESRAST